MIFDYLVILINNILQWFLSWLPAIGQYITTGSVPASILTAIAQLQTLFPFYHLVTLIILALVIDFGVFIFRLFYLGVR